MPAADFHNYARKVHAAGRRADPDATPAQREAGNARVGKLYAHGLTVSIEYPAGGTRRGTSPDGKAWARTCRHPYGYINKTDGGDGECLDVWVGPHPESQLAFAFSFLTDAGEFDEWKVVLGARNANEARGVIDANYPAAVVADRVGEVRGMFMPDFKKFIAAEARPKARRAKAAGAGYFCKRCNTFSSGRDDCPDCDKTDKADKQALDVSGLARAREAAGLGFTGRIFGP